jgi:hypothetical protein
MLGSVSSGNSEAVVVVTMLLHAETQQICRGVSENKVTKTLILRTLFLL